MKLSLFLAGLLLALGLFPAEAAEVGVSRKSVVGKPATIYQVIPRSPEASLVWAGDACWRGCAQDCGRHFQACLSADSAESCIPQNNACNRFCQRECRPYGGPLLPLD